MCVYVHKCEVQSSVLLYCARGFNPHVCAYQPPVDKGSTVWSKVPILGFSFWNTTFVPPSWAGASSAAGATGMYFCPLNIRWQQSPFCCWCYLDSSDHFPCGFLFHFPYRNSKWRIACTKWNCPMGPSQAALTNCCLVCVPGCVDKGKEGEILWCLSKSLNSLCTLEKWFSFLRYGRLLAARHGKNMLCPSIKLYLVTFFILTVSAFWTNPILTAECQ